METVLPVGRTFCSSMVYLQGDIFTRPFLTNSRPDRNYVSIHFGVSDNLFLSYLSTRHDESGLFLDSTVAPYQVATLQQDEDDMSRELSARVRNLLSQEGLRVRAEAVTRNRFPRARAKHRRRGVPLVLVFNRSQSREGKFRIIARKLGRPETGDVEHLDRVERLMRRNDEAIHEAVRRLLDETIENVSNVAELNDAVRSGRVARFFTRMDEGNVDTINRLLLSGEVLGFEPSGSRVGPDIVDHKFQGNLCFASRRI